MSPMHDIVSFVGPFFSGKLGLQLSIIFNYKIKLALVDTLLKPHK